MNNTLLARCLVELDKAEPRLDYVRGILETLIEIQVDEGTKLTSKGASALINSVADDTRRYHGIEPVHEKPKTEGQILDDIAKARLAGVKSASHVEMA